MRKSEKEQNIQKVNMLLSELYDLLENPLAKNSVQHAYNTINKPEKVSARYKEIPDAIKILKKDFSRLSLRKIVRFTRDQENIVFKLTVLSRRSFREGFDGMAFMNTWFV